MTHKSVDYQLYTIPIHLTLNNHPCTESKEDNDRLVPHKQITRGEGLFEQDTPLVTIYFMQAHLHHYWGMHTYTTTGACTLTSLLGLYSMHTYTTTGACTLTPLLGHAHLHHYWGMHTYTTTGAVVLHASTLTPLLGLHSISIILGGCILRPDRDVHNAGRSLSSFGGAGVVSLSLLLPHSWHCLGGRVGEV